MLKDTERKNIQLTYQSFNKQFSCYWCRFRDYEEWTSSDIRLCYWVRYFLLPWPWLFLFQFEKAHFHIMRNLLHLRVCIVFLAWLFGEGLITYVCFRGLAKRGGELFVWMCTRAHSYPAPWWSRICGMQRNAISGLKLSLITNRWVMHFEHNTWF